MACEEDPSINEKLICDVDLDTHNNVLSLSPHSSFESFETIEETRMGIILGPWIFNHVSLI